MTPQVAVVLLSEAVAVTMVVPAETAVMSPDEETVAMPVLAEDQVTD